MTKYSSMKIRHGLLALSALVCLMLAYRAYAGLKERHLSLERLYRFSQVVSDEMHQDRAPRRGLRPSRRRRRGR